MESKHVAVLVTVIYSNMAIRQHKNITHLRKCVREKKEKEKVRVPPMDCTARLDCCNLMSMGSDDRRLDLLGVGKEARKTQSPMGSNTLGLSGNAQASPLGASLSKPGGRPQK